MQARRRRPKPIPVSSLAGNKIPVVISCQERRPATITVNKASKTRRCLRPVQPATTWTQRHDAVERVPSLYVINAAALCKSHAPEHLSADLNSYCIDVAVVTETQFKAKHADSAVSIPDYTLLRRDRARRKDGGVALYARSEQVLTPWTSSADDGTFELLWARVNGTFFGASYHPP